VRPGRILDRLCTAPSQTENVDVRIEFTLDCSDLDRMATFWKDAAGLVVEGVIEGRYVALSGQGIALTLQHVDEPKAVKNRMHLDLLVDDIDQEVRRMESLGATRLTGIARQEFGQTWHVLTDPEGNEFCVASDRTAQPPPAER
jgi:predicted enzyme related to lactoylglutathione lyase